MKEHKQVVMIEIYKGYLEVISFYNTDSKMYGVDIYQDDRLVETVEKMKTEPLRDHMLSLEYNYLMRNDKSYELE